MKAFFLALAFVLPLCAAVTDGWIHDYGKGLETAKKEHKDIYLFIGADKCRFCKKFKERTLSQPKVKARLNAHFVTVYLSRDRHDVPDGFERFGAPRHYFLDADGKILDEDAGYLNAEAFMTLIDDVLLYKE